MGVGFYLNPVVNSEADVFLSLDADIEDEYKYLKYQQNQLTLMPRDNPLYVDRSTIE